MKYGFVLPYGDARAAAEYAETAEQAGWDGFFVWEPIYGWDAWVMLAAAAMRTSHIRLGTMISPLSRMRPWKIASETITLDHLSGGRVTVTVGLGAIDTGFDTFREAVDRRERTELLDESLAIITGLWAGQASHYGKHYQIEGELHYPPPPPVQQPRIPIWVVGAWPYEKSMQRALKYDGIVPSARDENGNMAQATPEQVSLIRNWLSERRDISSFDIIVEGTTSTSDPRRAAEKVQPWADAGATWFHEARWGVQEGQVTMDSVRRRLEAGPPRS